MPHEITRCIFCEQSKEHARVQFKSKYICLECLGHLLSLKEHYDRFKSQLIVWQERMKQ